MPIPLVEIPNAPQAGPAPAMAQVPQANTNLSGVARTLMSDGIQQGSFDGPAAGMDAIGRAVAGMGETGQRVAAVVRDYHGKKQKFQDSVTEAEALTELEAEFEKYRGGLPGTSEDGWAPKWQDKASNLLSKYTPERFSREGAQRFHLKKLQLIGEQTRQLTGEAVKSSYARGVNVRVGRAESLWDAGKHEEAAGEVGKLIDEGAVSREFGRNWLETRERKFQDDNLSLGMENNPKALAEALGSPEETKELFGEMSDTRRRLWQARASRQAKTVAQESFFGAQNAVASGEVESIDDVKNTFPDVEPRRLKLIERQLKDNREFDVSVDGPNFARARAAVLAYDGQQDGDGAEAAQIEGMISALPKKQAGMLYSALQQQWSSTWKDGKDKSNQQRLLGYWSKEIVRYGESYWDTGRDKKNSEKIVDPAKSQAFGERLNNAISVLEGWSKRNPDATPEQWKAQLSTVIGEDAAESAAKGYQEASGKKSGSWWQFLYPGDVDSPRTETQNAIPAGQIKEKLGPASIRYNNPGAQYPGPSSERFGATEVKIIGAGHKIAVFPDAESGAAAQFDLLNRSYAGKTVRDAITKWSGGNSVGAYLRTIKQEAGLDAETVLTKEMLQDPAIAIPLARSMARHEAGQDYPLTEEQWKKAHLRALKKS